jgi:hypothetical protein
MRLGEGGGCGYMGQGDGHRFTRTAAKNTNTRTMDNTHGHTITSTMDTTLHVLFSLFIICVIFMLSYPLIFSFLLFGGLKTVGFIQFLPNSPFQGYNSWLPLIRQRRVAMHSTCLRDVKLNQPTNQLKFSIHFLSSIKHKWNKLNWKLNKNLIHQPEPIIMWIQSG